MAIFDDNVYAVLEYGVSIPDVEIKHNLMVALVKDKAQYMGVDLFEFFFTNPYAYASSMSINEHKACEYMVLIPLLKKLYDVASAHNKLNNVRFSNRPCAASIEKIKREIKRL